MTITKLLSDLVIKNKTPHFNLYISNFFVKTHIFKNLSEEIVNSDKYNYFKFSKDTYFKHSNCIITEFCNGSTLCHFLVNNFCFLQLKIFLFQIISTIHVAQCEYPIFFHNSLHLNNIILIKNINKNDSSYTISKKNIKCLILNIQ